LIAEAGGDPWAINQSLQAGQPLQISHLAEAFHAAGRCTAEADAAFEQARRRFDGAWNHQNGDHPINDSAEVQRTVQSLGAQSLQLPKIGADLENIAAALAEAQKSAAGQIAALEAQLGRLDELIGQAVEMEKDIHLSAADRDALDTFVNACEDDAIRDTKAAVGQLEATRNGYSATLQNSLSSLRADGYYPASIQAVEGPQSPVPVLPDDPQQFAQAWNALTPEQKDAEYHQIRLLAAILECRGTRQIISAKTTTIGCTCQTCNSTPRPMSTECSSASTNSSMGYTWVTTASRPPTNSTP
ncbi:putative alpha/beta hydrolase, partial [Mycobacterium kansasii]|uniref:putative alpha/beta hydrolase n=1 Tax=Mycobacterium kansasii TaxID=1768 RepID=UPI004032F281